MIMAGYEWQKPVCYPISAVGRDGLQDINWIAELKYRDRPALRPEDWNKAGDLSQFLPQFESWNFGWLDCPGLITGAPGCLEFPMVDRDPLPAWSHGRVALMGDAAHPMYPIGSNGASQAILDARVLSWRLATESDPQRALALYDEERRPATSNIVLANRRNGPEKVMQMAQERAPTGFSHVHDVISADELSSVAREIQARRRFRQGCAEPGGRRITVQGPAETRRRGPITGIDQAQPSGLSTSLPSASIFRVALQSDARKEFTRRRARCRSGLSAADSCCPGGPGGDIADPHRPWPSQRVVHGHSACHIRKLWPTGQALGANDPVAAQASPDCIIAEHDPRTAGHLFRRRNARSRDH
jgi:hypothetical protein